MCGGGFLEGGLGEIVRPLVAIVDFSYLEENWGMLRAIDATL